MKKVFILSAFILSTSLASFAQNIVNPKVNSSETSNNIIEKIETTPKNTIVSFEYTAEGDNGWANINPEITLRTVDGRRYKFVKAENINVAPEQTNFAHSGDKIKYKVYFQKLPATAKKIDIIERDDTSDGNRYFNYKGVSLTEVAPPRPVITRSAVSMTDSVMANPMGMNGTADIFNAMGPMLGNMTRSMMDAQLEYYKQPGKLAELAKLNKDYYDELMKAGFSADQAMKIITADSLLPKTTGVK